MRQTHPEIDRNDQRIALVYFPWKSRTIYKFLDQLVSILIPISRSITLIGGNTEYLEIDDSPTVRAVDIRVKMHDTTDITPMLYSKALWALKAVTSQILEAAMIIRDASQIDIVVFYMSYPYDILPLITAKLLRKKTIIVVTRSNRIGTGPIDRFYDVQDRIMYAAADVISPECNSLVASLKLMTYRSKLTAEGYRYVDLTRYRVRKGIGERSNVGYVSRVEEQKGVLNFLSAAEILTARGYTDIPFLVSGDGRLKAKVEARVDELKTKGVNIDYVNWIAEDDFCEYLNEFKLLVFPTTISAAEGLPTIVIEAMACGTPVLTTAVAAIPNVIKDKSTGFLLENDSPECIANGILKALTYSDVDKVAQQARALIENKFSYQGAVERWRKIVYGT